jgi:6-phosphofructokinase
MDVFLSYRFLFESFVQEVSYLLAKQPNLKPYCYSDDRKTGDWKHRVGSAMQHCHAFVLFMSDEFGPIQEIEAEVAEKLPNIAHYVVVRLPNTAQIPHKYEKLASAVQVNVQELQGWTANNCARQISEALFHRWVIPDGLPLRNLFSSEEEIVDEYTKGHGSIDPDYVGLGCPKQWPDAENVPRGLGSKEYYNPVPEEYLGKYLDDDDRIVADPHAKVLSDYSLTYLMAGPRKYIYYRDVRVGIMVLSDELPGINAVIGGIVKRHELYRRHSRSSLSIHGYREGLSGLLAADEMLYDRLESTTVHSRRYKGGCLLGTYRLHCRIEEHMLEKACIRLQSAGIDILYVIGDLYGIEIAHSFFYMAYSLGYKLSIVGIPISADQEILFSGRSVGFIPVCEKAKEYASLHRVSAESNSQVEVVQLLGPRSSFVTANMTISSNVCDLLLIPEIPFSMGRLCKHIKHILDARRRHNNAYVLIVIAGPALPTDAMDYIEYAGVSDVEAEAIRQFSHDSAKFERGPNDLLCAVSLKVVASGLERYLNTECSHVSNYTMRPRVVKDSHHLLLPMDPTTDDILLGNRLGYLAVDSAIAGYSDVMVSEWLQNYVLVPLRNVVLGRKRYRPSKNPLHLTRFARS